MQCLGNKISNRVYAVGVVEIHIQIFRFKFGRYMLARYSELLGLSAVRILRLPN